MTVEIVGKLVVAQLSLHAKVVAIVEPHFVTTVILQAHALSVNAWMDLSA